MLLPMTDRAWLPGSHIASCRRGSCQRPGAAGPCPAQQAPAGPLGSASPDTHQYWIHCRPGGRPESQFHPSYCLTHLEPSPMSLRNQRTHVLRKRNSSDSHWLPPHQAPAHRHPAFEGGSNSGFFLGWQGAHQPLRCHSLRNKVAATPLPAGSGCRALPTFCGTWQEGPEVSLFILWRGLAPPHGKKGSEELCVWAEEGFPGGARLLAVARCYRDGSCWLRREQPSSVFWDLLTAINEIAP